MPKQPRHAGGELKVKSFERLTFGLSLEKRKGKDHKLCDLYPMIFLLNQRVQTQK